MADINELKEEELNKVSGGDEYQFINRTGYFSMYTSSMVEIFGAGGTYIRTDTKETFRITSVSNNCNPGENMPFSTTYIFMSTSSNNLFTFVATSTNNVCNYLE